MIKNERTPRSMSEAAFDPAGDPWWMPSQDFEEAGHRWLFRGCVAGILIAAAMAVFL